MATPESSENDRLRRMMEYVHRDPGNARLVCDAAELAMRQGQAATALPWVEAALASNPGDRALLSVKGNLLLAAHRMSEAETFFSQLRALDEKDPAVNFNLAYAQLAQGRAEQAQATLDQIPTAERGRLPRYSAVRAQALYSRAKLDEALAEVEPYLKLHPDDQEAAGLYAMLMLDTGRSQAAVAAVRPLLERQPRSWYGNYVLGSAALEMQDQRQAEQRFATAVESAPAIGRGWSGFGFAALMRRDLPQARQRFEEAVRLMPEHPGTWHGLAWTLILMGNLDGAREAVESAMSLDRNFADNHGTLAVIDALEGRLDDAELGARRALRLDPTSASGVYARSLVLRGRGDTKGADDVIRRALSERRLPDGTPLLEVIAQRTAEIRGAGTGKVGPS
jgi:Flp pilus assembly protein TadD